MAKKKEYIADYGEWRFESYWNDLTESWSVYQAKKTDDGYKLVTHCFRDEPIKTTEDAKEQVEIWLEIQRRILDKLDDESED
ncbi:MAG: hypothetical protein IJO04_05110 [Oscillospiraceae bacterium]|nr:hypothetical protein [Oscillospiraceae bacterium]